MAKLAKVFVSYAHKDQPFWLDLEDQLKILKNKKYLEWWSDNEIIPGDEWEKEIMDELANADIILLLVSTPFLASSFCWDVELKTAIERHHAKEVRVVPIFSRVCDTDETPIAGLQGLPNKDKPVSKWGDKYEAWAEVAKGIQKAVLEWRKGPGAGAG